MSHSIKISQIVSVTKKVNDIRYSMGHSERAQTVATFPPTWPLSEANSHDFPPQDKPLHSPPPSKQILEDVFVCNNLGGPQSEVSSWIFLLFVWEEASCLFGWEEATNILDKDKLFLT